MTHPRATVTKSTRLSSQHHTPTRRCGCRVADSPPTPRPDRTTFTLAGLAAVPHGAGIEAGRPMGSNAGPNLANRVRQGARGRARARWGQGVCRPEIDAPPCRSGRPRRAPGRGPDRAPKPVRLARIRRKCRKSKALRPPFQHRPSNTPRATPQKRLISAIPAPRRAAARSTPDRGRSTRRQLHSARKIAETFRHPRALHTPADGDRCRRAISGRQNIRLDEAERPKFRAVAERSNLQPLCNRCATTNRLIYIDMFMLVAELQDLNTPTCARAYAHAYARITRGHGLQLRNRREKCSDFNGLPVANWLQRGCGCNPLPRPGRSAETGCHLSRRPAGRGQTQSEIEGATRRASHLCNGGPGSR